MILVVNINDKNTGVLKKGPIRLAFFCLLPLIVSVLISACEESNPAAQIVLKGHTMGTTYNVKALPNQRTIISDSALQIQIDKELEAINRVMSTYIADSELSKFNQSDIDVEKKVSKWLLDVVMLAQQVSEKTGGAFDITVGPIVNLWGFGPENLTTLPTETQILAAKDKVGYQFVLVDEEHSQIKKTKDVYIDLSAIAKGYATDLIANKLVEFGFSDFMIEIGGELYVAGHNAHHTPWLIGVEKPSIVRTDAVQAISVSGVGIATSGDYRNFIDVEGKRVSHTIDPILGGPVQHNLASVTVIAESGALADAYSTALNVMGPNVGYKFAKENDLAAYFIVREEEGFSVKYTSEFELFMVEK